MRLNCFLRGAALAAVALFIVSCGSLEPQATGPRFHEAAAANVVLHYYGEASIFMTKPDTRENGFLPLLTRSEVAHSLERPEIGRDLAVVILGRMSPEQQSALIQSWQSDLSAHGFHRAVFLASGGEDQIDGLLILRDSAIAMRDVEPGQIATAVASAP